ncbi:DNA-binding protein Rfx5 [Bagarius yarrelli]|uniref:DNA-binding protein Rfx5 n=1 Tax=Bagarius yarrelli TaxID=175774 RepID=A0A556VAP9_BAGYA|nr:DNA-binding protein Rfx5 [Bagarius yarrelli]
MHKKLEQTGRVPRPAQSAAEFESQQDGEVKRWEEEILYRIQKLHEPLAQLSSKMDLLIRSVGGEHQRVSLLDEHGADTEARVSVLEDALDRTLDRLEDLEHGELFSRDIRIVGLKEGTEGKEPVKFFETWVPDVLGMCVGNNRIELERARRTGLQKRADGGPRAVLLRFHSYTDKRAVLEAARDKDTVRVRGRKIYFRDFSFGMQRKRARTTDARRQLRTAGLKHAYLHPAEITVLKPPEGADVYLHPVKVETAFDSNEQEAETEDKTVQSKVDTILRDVQQFTDNDKLYLYLQLPSGPSAGEKSSESNLVNTADQLHTCNWIRSHLEEHADTCLPKQDVYETYRGIRRKTVLNMPLLPNLDLKNDPAELTELVQTYKQEVTEAACELICDWAQKILKRSFDTVVEIARFLVQEHIVNPRCSQAELVTSASLAGGPAKPHKVIKKNPTTSRGGTAEEDSVGQDAKKDESEQVVSVKHLPNDKSAKTSEMLRYGGREMQVEALVKKLPQLRPRGSIPEKPLLSVHAPAPTFAPNDSRMTLPITVATLSPQQSGSALPLMILPPSVTVSTATAVTTSSKRASDSSAMAPGPPLKRKRGRPRKQKPEEAAIATPNQNLNPNLSVNPTVLNRGVIQKAFSSLSSQPTKPGVQCEKEEPELQPVMLLQEPGRAMVIQRAPVSRENRPVSQVHLPPPTVHQDKGVVEITLTPIDPLFTADNPLCSIPETGQGQGEEEEVP